MADDLNLTPEEFQQVAMRAAKTAPLGMSREEFAQHVQDAAGRETAAKRASVAPAAANPTFDPVNAVGGFLGQLGNAAKGLYTAATTDPRTTIKNLLLSATSSDPAHLAEHDKAEDAWRQGHYSEALGHAAARLLPFVGPAAADIGERIGQTGDVGTGLGEAAGLATLSSPSLVGRGLSGAGRTTQAVAGALRRPAQLAATGSAITGHVIPAAALAAGPPIIGAIGRGLSRAGEASSASAQSLQSLFDAAPGIARDVATRLRGVPAETMADKIAQARELVDQGFSHDAASKIAGVPRPNSVTDISHGVQTPGVTPDDLSLYHESVDSGMSPEAAAKVVAPKTAQRGMLSSLLDAGSTSRQMIANRARSAAAAALGGLDDVAPALARSRDPNNNMGIGDAELAGSEPYPHTSGVMPRINNPDFLRMAGVENGGFGGTRSVRDIAGDFEGPDFESGNPFAVPPSIAAIDRIKRAVASEGAR